MVNGLSVLVQNGIRVSVDAEEIIKNNDDPGIIDKLIKLNKPMITKEDLENLLKKETIIENVEIIRSSDFNPIAKEYSADIEVQHAKDVTGKSRTKGEVDDFVSYFKNRYERISRMLRAPGRYPQMDLGETKRHVGERVRVIVTVMEKRDTQKGNLLLEVEDLTGRFKVIITTNSKNEKLQDKSKNILLDDIIAITGKVFEPFIIAEDIEWPDIPVLRERKFSEIDVATIYISDLHFGSRYFLDHYLNLFVDWIHGKGEAKELAGKVKYMVVAGDLVDGIGIYPNQEKELVVKDIYKQYDMFEDFLEKIPDYVEVIISPGNHDAVRRGEPMPAIPTEFIKNDVIRVGNPSTVVIEGLKHLIYHGTSMDSLIAAIPNASYNNPEKVMTEYLKRRHLSPIYGGNLIIPEKVDYLVIDDPPDILHCGHVHKNGYMLYRGTLVINSGTFQDRTDYQMKQGHMPTPAMVPVYEMKYGRLRTLDFKV